MLKLPSGFLYQPSNAGVAVCPLGVDGASGVCASPALTAAVNAIEELEQTAQLMLLLRNQPTQLLTAGQVAELNRRFPN